MKTLMLTTATVLLLFALAGCGEQKKDYALLPDQKNSLPVDSLLVGAKFAKANIAAFDSLCKTFFDSVPVKAYTVHAQDLLAAMGMSNALLPSIPYKYIRVYLGYETVPKRDRDPGFRLYIVPVEGADLDGGKHIGGKDLRLDSSGHVIPSKNLDDAGEYVLDLNAPCPKTCPDDGQSLISKLLKKP